MVIMFAGALWQALTYCVHLNAELFSCGTLNTVETLSVAVARSRVFPPAPQFFSSLIDGCLKYKNKENQRPEGPRLNYDVKIGPKPGPRDVKTVRARRANFHVIVQTRAGPRACFRFLLIFYIKARNAGL